MNTELDRRSGNVGPDLSEQNRKSDHPDERGLPTHVRSGDDTCSSVGLREMDGVLKQGEKKGRSAFVGGGGGVERRITNRNVGIVFESSDHGMEASFDVELMLLGEDGFGEARLSGGDGEGDEAVWIEKGNGRVS